MGIAQSHLQMLRTGVHQQPAGGMLAERAAALAAAQHSEPLGPWLKPRPSLARCAPALAF